MFGDISNFNKVSDYLPIFNGVLISELFILILMFYKHTETFFKTNLSSPSKVIDEIIFCTA